MNKNCAIVADLMPLYEEDLIRKETKDWLEGHLSTCDNCKDLSGASAAELAQEKLLPQTSDEEMFTKINRKLSFYQISFLSLSLVLAMATSILNNSFQFLLTYPLLGLVIYLFYKDVKITLVVSFLPLFLWSFGEFVFEYAKGLAIGGSSFGSFLYNSILGAMITALIHTVFALIGSLLAYLILKIKGGDEDE